MQLIYILNFLTEFPGYIKTCFLEDWVENKLFLYNQRASVGLEEASNSVRFALSFFFCEKRALNFRCLAHSWRCTYLQVTSGPRESVTVTGLKQLDSSHCTHFKKKGQ